VAEYSQKVTVGFYNSKKQWKTSYLTAFGVALFSARVPLYEFSPKY